MWSYVWDRGKESVFLHEFCSKEVYSIHISLIPFGLLDRVSIPLLAASDFPTFSLLVQISQSTWIGIHLNSCPCVLVLNTEYTQTTSFSALCSYPHWLLSFSSAFSNQNWLYLDDTIFSAVLPHGRPWTVMERVGILKYFLKALIWEANFHF